MENKAEGAQTVWGVTLGQKGKSPITESLLPVLRDGHSTSEARYTSNIYCLIQ